MLTFEQIKDLIELVARYELGGLEIERSGFRLKIQSGRSSAAAPASAPASPGGADLAAPSRAHEPLAAQASLAPSVSVGDEARSLALAGAHLLTAPIVGTFYGAPSPDAEAFVRVGDRVRQGQVLCIVEAMKLMNEIESDVDGVVLEIYPKNAQPVEFGEPLFAIRVG